MEEGGARHLSSNVMEAIDIIKAVEDKNVSFMELIGSDFHAIVDDWTDLTLTYHLVEGYRMGIKMNQLYDYALARANYLRGILAAGLQVHGDPDFVLVTHSRPSFLDPRERILTEDGISMATGLRPECHFFVKVSGGPFGTFRVEIVPTDKVMHLKYRILAKVHPHGYMLRDVRLTFQGKRLTSDNEFISQLGIRHASVVTIRDRFGGEDLLSGTGS